MNKFIWSIFIPVLIFAGLLTVIGFSLESQHFYWLQSVELIYLFGSLIFKMKSLKVLWLILSLVFLIDLINTGVYLAQGQGWLWGMSSFSSAGPAFFASMLLLSLSFLGFRGQMKKEN